jgi:hypothetical protein
MLAAREIDPDLQLTSVLKEADVVVVTNESHIGEVLRDGAYIAVMKPGKCPWPSNVFFTDTREKIVGFLRFVRNELRAVT